MAIPNPWYTGNNPIESHQIPRQNLLQNLRSELIKRLDEEKKLSKRGKRSDCKSETTPTFRRIQDIIH